ncbi:hypothetical protein AB205_0078550, partial [Aquarana catesbeiana]
VKKYLEEVFAKLNSPNKLSVSLEIGAMPWVANVDDPQSNYIQGTKVFAVFFLELSKLHEDSLAKSDQKKLKASQLIET